MVAGTASTVFINEFHYDNDGTDAGEFVEIANTAGTDLTGWSVVLYNGNGGASYATLALAGSAQFTAVAAPGLQNGAPDGIALVDGGGNLVQFLSYEGSLTAVGGAANGLASTDIGLAQAPTEPVGSSLYLTGTGTTYGDFSWARGNGSNTSGAVNTGQRLGGTPPAPTVFLSEIHYDNTGADAGEFVEVTGDAGTDLTGWSIELYNGNDGARYATIALSGTIDDESGGRGALSFAQAGIQNGAPDGFALIDNNGNVIEFLSYEGSFAATSGTALGLTSTDIGVAEAGTEAVGLSLQKIGTSWVGPQDDSPGDLNTAPPPPPPVLTAIYTIQGAGHLSAFDGQSVTTSGIVTAVDTNGFYLQDATGDGNIATSDAIFVFTNSAPGVVAGDAVTVSGTVDEFTPGGAATGNLSITEIVSPTVTVNSSGNALPVAVVLGVDRIAPTEVIEDDNFTSFDPATDGIDFYESMESMLLTVNDPLVVAGTNRFGEIFTVANAGAGVTNLSSRGTMNIESTGGVLEATDVPAGSDYNPERIQIQRDSGFSPGTTPTVSVGALLGDVTGVLSYNFGNYEVLATTAITVESASTLTRETSTITGTADQLSVASYNVLNLDPGDGAAKFTAIAQDIVAQLNAPDIISLEEVQDNNGATNDGVVSASITLQMLVDAIAAAGGPTYSWIDNPFIGDDTNGGEPGGNIRVAFLYRDDRVDLVSGSVRTIEGEGQQTDIDNPFYNSRLPLAATFTFNGADITVVTNHFSSKGGSTPLYGTVQPSRNGSAAERLAQAEALAAFVAVEETLVDGVIVMGDFNEFEFEDSLDPLYDAGLVNLTNTLPEDERYSYIFEGNSQSLDHVFTTAGFAAATLFDAVHINAEFAETLQTSDHDPLAAGITLATAKVHKNGGKLADELAGTDTVEDVIAGNKGDDIIDGGGRDDTLFGNNGNDTLYGGTGEDTLYGGKNDDTLYGEAGADILYGDNGNDRLSGGAGADRFHFAKGFGSDVIVDFEAGIDTIAFTSAIFTSFAAVQAAWSQDGDDVLITKGANVVRIEGALLGELTQDSFLFV